MNEWLQGTKLAILGAARSGIAVAKVAAQRGAQVTLYDSKSAESLALDHNALTSLNIALVTGFDGRFLKDKVDVLVTSPGVDSRSPMLQNAVGDGIEVISEIEFAYRAAQAPIIAITGTNGKSTTTVMTYLCLKKHGAILCGNIYGSGYEEVPLTEAAAIAGPDQVLVAEISSFQLEWITSFRPKCAAITNITGDHLNRYNGFEDYARTKHRVYENMRQPDVFVRHDDPATAVENAACDVLETSLTDRAIVIGSREISFADLPFQERHNRLNGAMAGLLSFAFLERFRGESQDAAFAAVSNGLHEFRGLGHRMQRVGERDGVTLINNSMCTNPAALIASSSSIDAHQHLLVGGLTKELDFTPVGEYLKNSRHKAYLFGADANEINAQLGGGFPVFNTLEEAFEAATSSARTGEVVMLSPGCASMDQFTDFRARGDRFKNIAKEWLQHDQVPAYQ